MPTPTREVPSCTAKASKATAEVLDLAGESSEGSEAEEYVDADNVQV